MSIKKASFCLVLVFGLLTLGITAEGRSLSTLFKQIKPAVVVITTTEHGFSKQELGEKVWSRKVGSGVVVSKDGLIMTAAHVVQLADAVSVKLSSGHITSATILSSVVMADLALIKLDKLPEDLVVAEMGDSDKMEIGDEVFVVGSPYQVEYTLTVGHVSGRREAEGFSNELVPVEFLQTDAAINKGNSGGPMFNMDGQVVGIVSHIISESGGYEGLGFAVAINSAKELLLNQTAFWHGVEFFPLSQDLAKAFNLPQEYGFLIQRVAVDSLGHKLGLQQGKIPVKIGEHEFMIGGDIILEIQGIRVLDDLENAQKIRKFTMGIAKGQKIKIKVLRSGKIVTLVGKK